MASKVSGVIEYIQNENTKHAIAASAYGYCQTPANQSAKTVEMTNFILNEGVTVHIKFQYNNTASNPTLNINNTGAKSIVIYGITKAGTVDNTTGWHDGAVISFTYDGTNWVQSTSGINNVWNLINDTYNTLMPTDGTTNEWIKIGTANTSYGLLPSQSGNAGSGHNYLGSNDWYWSAAFIDTVHGSLDGNAATATKLSNTPNNNTTFLRGDNTWSNTLFGSFYIGNLTNTDSNLISAQSNSGNITLYSTGYSNGTYGARGLGVSAKKNSQNEDVPQKDIITIDDNNNAIFYGITYNSPTGSALCLNSGSGGSIIFQQNGVSKIRLDQSGILRPETDSYSSLGSSNYKWNEIYANNIYGLLTIDHTAGSNQELRIKYNNTIDYWLGIGSDNVTYGLYDNKLNSGSWILSAGTNNTWTLNGNAATATVASHANQLLAFAGDEVAIGATATPETATNTAVFINYRSGVNGSKTDNAAQITDYYFCNRKGHTTVTLHADSFSGNAATVSRATFGDANNAEHNANNIVSNGLYYYNSNGPSTTTNLFKSTDGAIYCQAYATNWVAQIAQDYRNGALAVRSNKNGVWQEWLSVPTMKVESGYSTLLPSDGINNWIKIGTANINYGLLPSQSGNAGNGHNYIGTSTWYWKQAYIDEIMTGNIYSTGMSSCNFGNPRLRHLTNLACYESGITSADGGASFTGTIKIKLPNTTSNHVMMVLRIIVYDYNTNAGAELLVSGYTYNNETWYNYSASVVGSYTKGIRLAYDGTNYCVLLGATNTTWNYTKVILEDVYSGYEEQPVSGYSITLITSESGYTVTGQVNTLLRADNLLAKTINIWPQNLTNYCEGIRIHASSNGWCTIMLCGSDNAADQGTSTNSWGIFNSSGTLYINKGASSTETTARAYADSNGWHFTKAYGAVWNDYAEFRKTNKEAKAGQVVIDNDDGSLSITNKRLMPGAQIVSDTFGFSIGESEEAKTPLAVSGRVLVYTYRPREEYHAGMAVCSAPNGTIDIMTREEIQQYPDTIIGIVSEIPDYEEWGTGKVKVNGRIWIKIK